MKILICNERFLFRFGLDRALIILGRGLRSRGHHVTVMGIRMDNDVIDTFANEKKLSPSFDGEDYLYSNEKTAQWLEDQWPQLFDQQFHPDIIIVGGWPFYAAIPFLSQKGKVIFMDCGAVPLKGIVDGGVLQIQQKVREMRRQYLRYVSLISPISNFLAITQSKLDVANHQVPVETILLGADHMDMDIWNGLQSSGSNDIFHEIEDLREKGQKIIINLGRWEPGNYKNSLASFRVLGNILHKIPNCVLLVLANEFDLEIPVRLRGKVIPIGFPDDNTLAKMMRQVDLGISVSLWEGFNLPLAEMQHLERPVLVFDVGAHPEVVYNPWFLCKDENEMYTKAITILATEPGSYITKISDYRRFHDYFRWERFLDDWEKMLLKLLINRIQLFIHVNNSTRDPANSGVIRVTRRISHSLQDYIEPIFVIWDDNNNQYVFPTQDEYNQLAQFNGPQINSSALVSQDTIHRLNIEDNLNSHDLQKWLLLPETVNPDQLRKIHAYADCHEMPVAAIFYDAIPILRPDLCSDEIKQTHAEYMAGLALCEVVIPISNFAANTLIDYWQNNKNYERNVIADVLPGEFAGIARATNDLNLKDDEIKILCVSTLEPRKNHRNLISACLRIEKLYPEVNWNLTLVGNRYAGSPDISDFVEMVAKNNPRIKWLGIVDDIQLGELYRNCTFTIYPSVIEGFGMPILESIWNGKPCICYQEGVMAELAAEGGCLTTDVLNIENFSEAIYRLATDKSFYKDLCDQAIHRNIRNWDNYARDFLSILWDTSSLLLQQAQNKFKYLKWEDILYPDCLTENWQMTHSERLALTTLLTRHKPHCSIEIGTYKGGSLSLISQFSDIVFSIDIDEEVPAKFSFLENVIFLTGPSTQILPILFQELDQADLPVEFILIDGDHSESGIKQDIGCILAYQPKQPLFIMMHDSFNPDCRKGMLGANWESSPFVHWLDLDFVPGRLIENGGLNDGELWGGLGLAFIKPDHRKSNLDVQQSAFKMQKVVEHHFLNSNEAK